MRLAPVVLYYVDDYDTALNEAERSSRTTHQATEALFACRYLAHILYRCIYLNVDKASITAEFKEIAPTETLQALLDKTYRDKTANEISSSGYVVACLEAALWAFEQTDTFESALLLAANLGDDSDTVAAVCGQIAGAYYGEQAIPSHWLAVLFERERIEAIAKQLIGARSYI